MNLENHPAGYRQVTMLLFDQRISVVPYPPCSDIFKGLAFPPDSRLAPATSEENYYQLYFAIAAVLQPQTYLEIGTRFGYSTVAVARGAPELRRMVSCDLQTYENPYLLPSQEIAERNLRSSGFMGETTFIAADSCRLSEYVSGDAFDLILIDGDHSQEGCRRDILTCYQLLSPHGVIMIDDLDIPSVFSAVMDCMRDLKVSSDNRCFVPTKHGLYLMRHP